MEPNLTGRKSAELLETLLRKLDSLIGERDIVSGKDGRQRTDPILVGRKLAAKLLDISLRKLDYLIAKGELPSGKVGRRVVLPYKSLLRFAERNTRATKQMAGSSETS